MGNALTTFDFNSNSIRVIDMDGEPWFILRDVLTVLGVYLGRTSKAPNVSMAIKALAPDQFQLNPIELNKGNGTRKVMLVSESGLYRFVMRSDKPEARAFQDWVTRVVLPAIRKDGAYIAGEEKVASGELSEDPVFWGSKI